MKNLLILPLLFVLSLPASAQWVTIPDDDFVDKLNELFPECMDGDQLNISCTEIIEATSLEISFSSINDLTGIQYFINLEYLACAFNGATFLPELPGTLKRLICYGNVFNELPELPQSLQMLWCNNTGLTELPELPQSLDTLLCFDNELIELPSLPGSLIVLDCKNNNLNELPSLPSSLIQLVCHENNLITLPELPPTLQKLGCSNNQLTCLPTLPMSLTEPYLASFNISNNPFTCLPNYVPAMSGGNAEWLSFPLCGLGDLDSNPYGCSSVNGISGNVFDDLNSNCEVSPTETGVINATIKLLDEENEFVASTYTFGTGNNMLYNLEANIGDYSVQLITENMPFQVSCADPGDMEDVELTADEPTALNVDFGVECLPGFDVGVQSVATTGWLFPGQEYTLNISAGDMSNWYGLQCAEGVGGSVTVNITGPVSYVEPTNGALVPVVSGDIQLTYDIADFGDADFENSFGVILETDTTAQTDDLVCIDVTVEPIEGDAHPENNTYTHCYPVVNSYDPNIKQVWPQNVEPGYDGYFNYTIYFQNTGTAPAFNIRVADTLDTNLDLNTFEVTGYSHPCLTYVSGNVATFRFNNIMLPDSTSDFDGSIGYVQYRIKPIADLPVGTVIENTAHIYFDFNDAIVTNTTENEFIITTSVTEQSSQHVQVFPNPGTGLYNVSLHSSATGISMMEVFTLSGVRVLEQSLSNRQTTLDLTNQPPGMYLLRLQNELGSQVVKIVKH